MAFIDRRTGHPVRHLEWRVRIMGAGALLSLIGIYYQAKWLIWVAIAVLVAGFLMRFWPEEGDESEEEPQDREGDRDG